MLPVITPYSLPSVSNLIIGILVFVFLFLIFRVIILWYWRINDVADSLKQIADSLKEKSEKEE